MVVVQNKAEETAAAQFTPHLYHDPAVRKLREYEEKKGIVGMGGSRGGAPDFTECAAHTCLPF